MFQKFTPASIPLARLKQIAFAGALFSLVAMRASAQNITLTVDGNIPTGTYENITVIGPAVATISGAVTVTGTFRLRPGNPNGRGPGAGVRITDNANFIAGNAFIADSAALITFSNPTGIGNINGTAGAIRTTTKVFDNDCDFTYIGNVNAPLGSLGEAFPARVRNLTINRPNGVNMVTNTGVREVLTMRNGILFTNGFVLTLISNAPDVPGLTAASTTVVNFGSVPGGNRSFISGPVTVERYINPRFNRNTGYRHYSSSVTGSTVGDLTVPGVFTPVVNPMYNTVPYEQRFIAGNVVPFPNTFYYDQAFVDRTTPGATARTDFDRGYQSPNALTDPLIVTKGYSVRIPAVAKVDFVGLLNQDQEYPTPLLIANNELDGGWQLVGNPYASKIDWNLVTRDTSILDQISQYRATGLTEGFYSTYINGVGNTVTANGFTITGSSVIAQNQAFFTRVRPGQSGRITFSDDARLVTFQQDPTAPFFRPAKQTGGNATNSTAAVNPMIRLSLADATGNNAYGSVVYFRQGATYGYDDNMDAVHTFGGFPVQLYSMAGRESVDINALPPIGSVADYTLPLHMIIGTAGTYTMSATELTDLPAGYQVLLQDAVTGTTQDLTLNRSFTFTTGANTNLDRFTIRLIAQRVTGTVAAAATRTVEVYPNPLQSGEAINLNVLGLAKGTQVTAALFNQLGQRVWTRTYTSALGGLRESVPQTLARGVYTLRVQAAGQTDARRIVIK